MMILGVTLIKQGWKITGINSN